jgi:hypothetical protein
VKRASMSGRYYSAPQHSHARPLPINANALSAPNCPVRARLLDGPAIWRIAVLRVAELNPNFFERNLCVDDWSKPTRCASGTSGDVIVEECQAITEPFYRSVIPSPVRGLARSMRVELICLVAQGDYGRNAPFNQQSGEICRWI